jgi:thioredoxin-related protein
MKETNLAVDQITTIDSSCSKEMFQEYNVRSVPTSIILVDGKEVQRYTGYRTKEDYLSFVDNS